MLEAELFPPNNMFQILVNVWNCSTASPQASEERHNIDRECPSDPSHVVEEGLDRDGGLLGISLVVFLAAQQVVEELHAE